MISILFFTDNTKVLNANATAAQVWQLRVRAYRDPTNGWSMRVRFKSAIEIVTVPGFQWLQRDSDTLYIYASAAQFLAGAVQYDDGFAIVLVVGSREVKAPMQMVDSVAWSVASTGGSTAAAAFTVFHSIMNEFPLANEFTALLEIHALVPCTSKPLLMR